MAVLTGYAVPLQGGLPADHTYVLSSDGFKWGCWGRDYGGAQICAGSGSSTVANCISQANSQSGLIYGVTGVCHQTANRILYPARVLVSRSRGYWLSVALYGTYGSDGAAWPARVLVCTNIGGAGGGGVDAMQDERPGEQEYLARVLDLYASSGAPVRRERSELHAELLAAELELLLDFRAGPERRETAAVKAVPIQQATLRRKESLDRQVQAGEIGGKEYAERVNALATEMAGELSTALGPDVFTRAFEHTPGEPVIVVEPDVAEKVYGPAGKS